jgi:hypothetical protein
MKKLASILLFAIFCAISSAQSVLFVNTESNAAQPDGTSWSLAFPDLNDALNKATYGDQIWIARGTYYPTATTDRTISFQLKNGVSLFGGFDGTETSLEQRNPSLNPTRLSGNIGDTSIASDNTIHVVIGIGLDEQTVLDGLVFSDGYSVGSFDVPTNPFGAGMYLLGSAELPNSRPVITHCIFENNRAGSAGGGLFISFIEPEHPTPVEYLINPVIKNCTFRDNYAQLRGGAMFKQGPTAISDTFKIENCQFTGNTLQVYEGAAMCFQDTRQSNFIVRNCVFDANKTTFGGGGGFYIPTFSPGNYTVSVIVEHCIFKKNEAGEGGGFLVDGRVVEALNINVNVIVTDCLFEENVAINDWGSAILVTYKQNAYLNATIKNCTFLKNYGVGYFTLAILSADECTQDALIENCLFYENYNRQAPATYFFAIGAGGSKFIHTKINNCVFVKNGNAIFAGGGEQAQATTNITNCTFFRNGKLPFGKRWYPSFQQAGAMYYNNMNFKNCVIWEDLGNPSFMFYNNYMNQITGFGFKLDYCSFNPFNPAVIPNSSTVLGDSIYFGQYPAFLDTANLDFRLDKCSFAINKGSNLAVADAGLLNDLDNQPRIRFDTVDLGAYEQQTSCVVSTVTNAVTIQKLLLTPNPGTGDVLSFELPDLVPTSGSLRIYSTDGVLVHEQQLTLQHTNQVSALALPPGTYHVLVRAGDTAYTGKWSVVR